MEPGFPIPPGITNEALWWKHCRQIRARAQDLLDGKLGVIEAARALLPLALRTHAQDAPEFEVFNAIDSETLHLPVGAVRAYWAPEALAREDVTIQAAEARWRLEGRSCGSVVGAAVWVGGAEANSAGR